MKRLSFLLFLLLVFKTGISQDTIIKNDGVKLVAKILEVTPGEIRYKKFSFLEGPTYVESKSGINYIIYSNGIREQISSPSANTGPKAIVVQDDNTDYYNPNAGNSVSAGQSMQQVGQVKYLYKGNRIGEREMQSVLMKTQNREIVTLVQQAKDAHKLQYIGFAAFPLGMGALIALVSSVNSSGTLNGGYFASGGLLMAAAIACPIYSGISKHKRNACNRKAVQLYNEKF